MTPVTGGIPDREEDGTVLPFRCLQGLWSPGVPVDRVRGMLEEIGTGFVDEAIRSCGARWSLHGPTVASGPERGQ